MKKIILFFVFILSLFSFWISYSSDCNYDPSESNDSISAALDKCLDWSALVDVWDATIDNGGWFQNYIKKWTNNIALYLGVFAVFAIVFGAIMLTISTWEDEKISKAKNIIKWWLIWFIAVITASFIINLIIRVVYDLGNV